MSKTKHTPGPLQYCFEGGTVAFIVEPDGTVVAKLSVTMNSTGHSALVANTRLFAAAPDLLEAAEIQQQCGMPVKATFWDAEGIEGWRWSHPDGRVWEVVSDWNEPIPIHPMMAAAIAKAKEGNPS